MAVYPYVYLYVRRESGSDNSDALLPDAVDLMLEACGRAPVPAYWRCWLGESASLWGEFRILHEEQNWVCHFGTHLIRGPGPRDDMRFLPPLYCAERDRWKPAFISTRAALAGNGAAVRSFVFTRPRDESPVGPFWAVHHVWLMSLPLEVRKCLVHKSIG